jgi:dUTP pyrophosphatase
MTLELKVKKLRKVDLPKAIEIGNWIDLRAAEECFLAKDEFKLIPLGIAVQIPEGYEMNIVPRSSTLKNFGILQGNHFGVIDNSYCGDNDELFFPAYATMATYIPNGARICQFRLNKVMEPIKIIQVDSLNNPDRGGHGSTGVK